MFVRPAGVRGWCPAPYRYISQLWLKRSMLHQASHLPAARNYDGPEPHSEWTHVLKSHSFVLSIESLHHCVLLFFEKRKEDKRRLSASSLWHLRQPPSPKGSWMILLLYFEPVCIDGCPLRLRALPCYDFLDLEDDNKAF
jgi:hypothetical protein